VGTPHSSTLLPPFNLSHITAALARCLRLCLATKTALGCHNYLRRPCQPTPLTSQWRADQRDNYSRPRLPTSPPSQWRGRPESRAPNKRRKLCEFHLSPPYYVHNLPWKIVVGPVTVKTLDGQTRKSPSVLTVTGPTKIFHGKL
jgi:hypothetical protein